MADLQIGSELKRQTGPEPALDQLYADFNYPDSATDPIQIVRRYERADDREVVGFIAGALAFGRVASVLQSIERVLAVMGPDPAAYVRQFDPRRDGPAFAGIVHRWTRGPDIVALLWLLRQMIDRAGSVEGFFLEGYDAAADDIEGALDSFFDARVALDLKAAYGRGARTRQRARASVISFRGRRPARLQAPESVSALDGPARRARSRRLAPRVAGQADRAARHARDSRRPLPAADDVHEPRVAHGARHHGVAAAARSGRSREVRLLALPPRDDERVRVQPPAGGLSVSATWGLPATRAYTAAVSATIRSTVKRVAHARKPRLPHPPPELVVFERAHDRVGQRGVIARRHEQARSRRPRRSPECRRPASRRSAARRPSRRAATCRALR